MQQPGRRKLKTIYYRAYRALFWAQVCQRSTARSTPHTPSQEPFLAVLQASWPGQSARTYMRGAHLDMLKQPEARHVATSDWEKKHQKVCGR